MNSIALVLPGAGAKGAYYEGVIQAIEKLEIPISKIYGASIGAIEGACYALGWPDHAREDLWYEMGNNFDSLAKSSLIRALFFNHFSSLKSDWKLKNWIQDKFNFNFLSTKIPISISVADLRTGDSLTIDSGSMANALMASTALPPALSPHKFLYRESREIWGADGGLNNNIMLETAYNDQYRTIILPLIGKFKEMSKRDLRSWIKILFRALAIKTRQEVYSEVDWFKTTFKDVNLIVIEPSDLNINEQSALDFDPSFITKAINCGYRDAMRELPTHLGKLVAKKPQ